MKTTAGLRVILIGFVLVMFLAGCSPISSTAPESTIPTALEATASPPSDAVLDISGLAAGPARILLSTIYKMPYVEQEISNISSRGEITKLNIKGVKLNTILEGYQVKQDDYSGIRFYAHDGYSIQVPREILVSKDIILIYEAEGQPLIERHQPIRVAVNEERSMYWVGNLAGMELIMTGAVSPKKLVLLEQAVRTLKQSDYKYYDSVDKAIMTADLLDQFAQGNDAEEIIIKSADGLEKTETPENFLTGYIKITGDDQPLFLSPELPRGMHVKNILYLSFGDTVFLSLGQYLAKYPDELETVGSRKGFTLKNLLDAAGLVGSESYSVLSTSGQSVTVELDAESLIFQELNNTWSIQTATGILQDIIHIESKI